MTFRAQKAKASTLIDILKQIKGALDAMGIYLPTLIGKAYESEGVGSAPRVIFIPDESGKLGPPRELGNAASVTHGSRVLVRGRESGDDTERSKEVYALADIVIGLIQIAGTGRIEWGKYEDASPTNTDAFGAEIRLTFTYRRDVAHNDARWRLAPAEDDTSAAEPQPPPGEIAGGIEIDAQTVPVETGDT